MFENYMTEYAKNIFYEKDDEYFPASPDNNWDDMSNIEKPMSVKLILFGRPFDLPIHYASWYGNKSYKKFMIKNASIIVKKANKYGMEISSAGEKLAEYIKRDAYAIGYPIEERIFNLFKYIHPTHVFITNPIVGKSKNRKSLGDTSAVVCDYKINDAGIALCMHDLTFTGMGPENIIL